MLATTRWQDKKKCQNGVTGGWFGSAGNQHHLCGASDLKKS